MKGTQNGRLLMPCDTDSFQYGFEMAQLLMDPTETHVHSVSSSQKQSSLFNGKPCTVQ